MPELVIPANLTPKEIRYAEEVAEELQLETERSETHSITDYC